MLRRRRVLLVLLLGVLAGCGSGEKRSGVGDVLAIDASALRVTIDHDEIPGLMGAMTMTFPVRSPDVLAGVAPGMRVSFDLMRRGNELVVTRLAASVVPRGSGRGVHDHTPHHGGVVTMVGMRHLEAVAAADGTVRVYPTDVWRRPLSLVAATGTVTLLLPEARRELPLVVRDDALVATGPPLGGAMVAAIVEMTQGGEPMEAHFMLPLGNLAQG